jgi:hypothetical protein
MLSAYLVRGLMKLLIAGLRTSKRWTEDKGERGIGQMISESKSPRFEGRVDLDSHADTCIMGKVFHIYSATGQKCTVMPYLDKYKPRLLMLQTDVLHLTIRIPVRHSFWMCSKRWT